MSQKKLSQAYILVRLISDENFTIAQAAETMGLSERQVKLLKGEFKKSVLMLSFTKILAGFPCMLSRRI